MWLNETLASGMAPYNHFVGAEKGFGEDRRWQKVGRRVLPMDGDAMMHTSPRGRSIANIGVVIGPEHATALSRPGHRAHAHVHARDHARHV